MYRCKVDELSHLVVSLKAGGSLAPLFEQHHSHCVGEMNAAHPFCVV